MELKAGKRYLIVRSLDDKSTEADLDSLDGLAAVINEVVVDEISISGKYVKFNSFMSLWNRIDLIHVLEELPDREIKNSEITQGNVYEKLVEVLTKILDKKINKHKIGKRRKCVKSGFGKYKK